MAQSKHDQHVINVLQRVGLIAATKITNTLQGSIWRALQINDHDDPNDKNTVIIKITNQLLHANQISVVNGKKYHVTEDILSEQNILRYLCQHHDCPKSVIQFHRFFRTNTDFYLVEQDGGSSLFEFIIKAHNIIKAGNIEISEWKKVIKTICQQMVDCIAYLHAKNVCHSDISLENFLINDVNIQIEQKGQLQKLRFATDDIQIKICDFGLAQVFTNKACLSNKHCGKDSYKSPEVVNKNKWFDAKKNDVWCIGVCVFMIASGCAPFTKAEKNNKGFEWIINGKLNELLKMWNISHLFDFELCDLLQLIFTYEQKRISLTKIKQHSWLK